MPLPFVREGLKGPRSNLIVKLMFVSVTKAMAGGVGNHTQFYIPDTFLIDLASCKALINIRMAASGMTASRMTRMDIVTAIQPLMATALTAPFANFLEVLWS